MEQIDVFSLKIHDFFPSNQTFSRYINVTLSFYRYRFTHLNQVNLPGTHRAENRKNNDR